MKPSGILTYHSVDPSGSVISIAPEIFRMHMEALAQAGIPVVPLSRIRNSTGSVALTFDDGFANLADHVFPVLREHGFSATVFLVSGYCGRSNDWVGQSASVPRLPLLSWSAVQQMSGGLVDWGAHTVTHPDLATVSEERAEEELRDCRATIEDRTGIAVRAFAYPYGSHSAGVRAAAAKHFDIACGTRLRYLNATDDPFDLPRLDAYYLREPARVETILRPSGRAYVGFRRVLREGRSWLSR